MIILIYNKIDNRKSRNSIIKVFIIFLFDNVDWKGLKVWLKNKTNYRHYVNNNIN